MQAGWQHGMKAGDHANNLCQWRIQTHWWHLTVLKVFVSFCQAAHPEEVIILSKLVLHPGQSAAVEVTSLCCSGASGLTVSAQCCQCHGLCCCLCHAGGGGVRSLHHKHRPAERPTGLEHIARLTCRMRARSVVRLSRWQLQCTPESGGLKWGALHLQCRQESGAKCVCASLVYCCTSPAETLPA